MHYAIHGHTAAELILERANSEKEHMGLTTWENGHFEPTIEVKRKLHQLFIEAGMNIK